MTAESGPVRLERKAAARSCSLLALTCRRADVASAIARRRFTLAIYIHEFSNADAQAAAVVESAFGTVTTD